MKTNALVKVKLTVGSWGGSFTDRTHGGKVARDNAADEDRVRLLITCLDKKDRDALGYNSHQLRSVFNRHTVRWGEDSGWNVLRADKLPALKEAITKLIAERRELVDAFLRDYDKVRAKAQQRLGKLWNEEKFLPKEHVVERFEARMNQDVVTDPSKIDLMADADVTADVRKDIERQVHESATGAVRQVIEELTGLVQKIVDRVKDRDQKRARYAMIAKTIDRTCDALDDLNLFGDAKIADGIAAVRRLSVLRDPKELRKSGRARGEVAKEGDRILDQLNKLF